jgi:hypothetical protein
MTSCAASSVSAADVVSRAMNASERIDTQGMSQSMAIDSMI